MGILPMIRGMGILPMIHGMGILPMIHGSPAADQKARGSE